KNENRLTEAELKELIAANDRGNDDAIIQALEIESEPESQQKFLNTLFVTSDLLFMVPFTYKYGFAWLVVGRLAGGLTVTRLFARVLSDRFMDRNGWNKLLAVALKALSTGSHSSLLTFCRVLVSETHASFIAPPHRSPCRSRK